MGDMNIQWFPGHMTKTKRKITESLALVDCAIEITDARLPQSSRNPDLDEILQTKPRIVLLNKSDMADPAATEKWVSFFGKDGIKAISIQSKNKKGYNLVLPAVKELLHEQIKKNESRGMVNRAIRMLIVGIPNVGKSTFINQFSGGSRARVEDRPGVTRGNQWFTVQKGVEMLDTPGILWPKFEDGQVALNLAYTGAVKDQILDIETLAINLLVFLRDNYSKSLFDRYKMENLDGMGGLEMLEYLGKRRGMLISKGEVDTFRAANTLLDEFRGGLLGRITLEIPEN